jgi:hypothetical protein
MAMFRWVFIFLLVAPLLQAAETIQSQSRQFNIYAPRKSVVTGNVPAGSVVVEPELLAITADRVRQAVVAQVPAMNVARGKIHLYLAEEATPNGMVGIVSTRYNDGWNYRVIIPPVVEETRLVRALVQVLLLEYAQRTGDRAAELPAWAVEGLTQQIFHTVGPTLVVGRDSVGWEASVRDLNGRAREVMSTNAAPSFHELTTLSPPPTGAPAEVFYQSCAHLLVRSLFLTPNGRQRFASFLQMLPMNWNWQTAFRQAFGFEKMLDVEKWWALVTVEFTTRDQRQAWSPPASLQRLDELLGTRVQFRGGNNSLPEVRQVDLKSFLKETDWTLQRGALTEKIGQLGYTAAHLAPQIGTLALEYRKVLEGYVKGREPGTVRPGLPMTWDAYQQKVVSDTIKKIEALDAKRRAMVVPTVSSAR